MRLIHTKTLELKEFTRPPPYAVLSHTWEDEEVTLDDMASLRKARRKAGFAKIQHTCDTAFRAGIQWAWVDTCCIDKSSSAELTESINAMFNWYREAEICYAYISDWAPDVPVDTALRSCRWMTRGWTLQELIAPYSVQFFDRGWNLRGDKHRLHDVLSTITGINDSVLKHPHNPLKDIPIARRMSWAARRTTTRVEDIAYCLLGIFDVNMPLLYGEGRKAFTRLQHEIIRASNDLSLFAWTTMSTPPSRSRHPIVRSSHTGILACDPSEFAKCGDFAGPTSLRPHTEFSVTNNGLRIPNLLTLAVPKSTKNRCYVLPLNCTVVRDGQKVEFGIYLCQVGPNLYCRIDHYQLCSLVLEREARSPSYDAPSPTRGANPFVFLSPLAAAPLYLSLDSWNGLNWGRISPKGAIGFRFPRTGYFSSTHMVQASPQSHYDNARSLFLTSGDPRFKGRVTIPLIWGPQKPVYIICGFSNSDVPWYGLRQGWESRDSQGNLFPLPGPDDPEFSYIMTSMERTAHPTVLYTPLPNSDGETRRCRIELSLGINTSSSLPDDAYHIINVDIQDATHIPSEPTGFGEPAASRKSHSIRTMQIETTGRSSPSRKPWRCVFGCGLGG